MPPRKRNAESRRGGEKGRPKRNRSISRRRGPKSLPDPSDHPEAEVRFIQPYEAVKVYLCPGCRQEIPEGTGHVVAVPPDAPDLRRHWHRGCWTNRKSRR